MREHLEALMLVLAVGSAVAIVAKRAGTPYNVALVVVGLLLVVTGALPRTPLHPDILLVGFLPALVFEGALFADLDQLRASSRAILFLAVPGVALSVLGTAGIAAFALGLPFRVALLLGSLLAITDTVSVLVAFRSVRVPARLAAIIEGENLFNDGTALVLVSVTASLAAGTHAADATPLADAVRDFLLATVGGAALGSAFGAIGAMVLARTPDHLTAILATIVLVFSTSLLAEKVHASPVIAVVVAGLMVGRAARRMLGPSRVLALEGFWEVAGFALNVLVFLLIGMQIDAPLLVREAGSIALAVVALHAGRAIAVYGGFAVLRLLRRDAVPVRWQHVMLVGNIKGSLSMAAVLALPDETPFRARLVAIVFGVTFVTLITQALPFRRALGWLGVLVRDEGHVRLDRARASLLAARRGQTELDELLSAGLLSRRAHAERRAAYQAQVVDAEATLREGGSASVSNAHVEMALLQAQKASLLDAARKGVVTSETVDAYVTAIDESVVKLRGEDER